MILHNFRTWFGLHETCGIHNGRLRVLGVTDYKGEPRVVTQISSGRRIVHTHEMHHLRSEVIMMAVALGITGDDLVAPLSVVSAGCEAARGYVNGAVTGA